MLAQVPWWGMVYMHFFLMLIHHLLPKFSLLWRHKNGLPRSPTKGPMSSCQGSRSAEDHEVWVAPQFSSFNIPFCVLLFGSLTSWGIHWPSSWEPWGEGPLDSRAPWCGHGPLSVLLLSSWRGGLCVLLPWLCNHWSATSHHALLCPSCTSQLNDFIGYKRCGC